MSDNIRIYKVLDKKKSINIEIKNIKPPFILDIHFKSKIVKSIFSKKNFHNIPINKSGRYSVSLRKDNNEPLISNTLYFTNTDFETHFSDSKLSKRNTALPIGDEILSYNIQQFYLEIKTKKSQHLDIKKHVEILRNVNIQKRKINLDSFPEGHSIHYYEYYSIHNVNDIKEACRLCKQLESIDGVEYASIIPKFTASEFLPIKASDEKTKTPDFTHLQGYLDDPHGMNIRNAWEKGTTGESVTIRHLDFGLYHEHEDLKDSNIIVISSRKKNSNHGTASVGVISASKNSFGITGIAHDASLYFYDSWDKESILEQAKPGDIISFDIQFNINDKLVPAIALKGWWDTFHNLTEKGAIVITAAGNGGVNLADTSICPDFGDCGAILVGACSSTTGRRLSFSNYGHHSSLINSWGENVTTTGYSDLQDLEGNNQDYTETYNGTSSATPLCSGALALLQCYAKKRGLLLTPFSMRKLLSRSSYNEGIQDGIGKRPNIDQLLSYIDEMVCNEPNYHKLEFKNGEDITNDILAAALEKHNHILVELKNGHWVKQITVPPCNNDQTVKVHSTAKYSSTLIVNKKKHTISTGEQFIVSCKYHWELENQDKKNSIIKKYAYQLHFKNAESITEGILNDAFKSQESVYVDIKNGEWVKEITLPKAFADNKKCIITSSTIYNSKLIFDGYSFIIKSGDILSISSKASWRVMKN